MRFTTWPPDCGEAQLADCLSAYITPISVLLGRLPGCRSRRFAVSCVICGTICGLYRPIQQQEFGCQKGTRVVVSYRRPAGGKSAGPPGLGLYFSSA
ncbi:hypothetical protein NDU88_002214 [Pleurodeles waltl]|uniref:Uncharacterized protein n=1 Tax=Pleurodeles waltl TaxID=8319 RepID=A0AAV7SEV0_PLEWA|nr:hypothetical protein NDU88_002214 [Pleurodeles waltl]